MNPFEEHAAGLAELQTELGAACPVFTWQGQTIKILPGTLKLRSSNSPGGLGLDCDFRCVALRADFGASLPNTNQKITYLNKRLKLSSVMVCAGGTQLILEANDEAEKL